MSGLNLGKLMAEAGVKGAKPSSPPLTLEEARALSINRPEKVHSQTAMKLLPVEFARLLETSKGGEFMDELRRIMDQRESDTADGKTVSVFDRHTVYGIVQLAHSHRDGLTGSRRKSFIRIIPRLLKVKVQMEKKNPANVADFFRRSLWPPQPRQEDDSI